MLKPGYLILPYLEQAQMFDRSYRLRSFDVDPNNYDCK
jgi:hypothetical protein